MARPRIIDEELVKQAQHAVSNTTKDARELRCAQAVLLPSLMGTTLDQTAALLGVSRASVPRLQARFRQSMQTGKSPPNNWGGRRRELMTFDEEIKFLEPWEQQAKDGGILVVSVIRAALAQHLGRSVKASVVYRLLERHGWRKVAPDTHHPKSDLAAQEEWKKNFRKHWRPS
jgi:transposase